MRGEVLSVRIEKARIVEKGRNSKFKTLNTER